MAKSNEAVLSFNRGILSPLGLARLDIARYKMAASVMVNFVARVLGSMMLRPGWQYLGATKNNAKAVTLPFVFSASDVARLEVTQAALRVWVNDALVTRPAVTATITNGTFVGSLTGWTVSDESGAASTQGTKTVMNPEFSVNLFGGFATALFHNSVSKVALGSVTGPYASLVGTGTNNAIIDQQVTVNEPNIEHALRIVIARGPVVFRCGTIQGDDSYIAETTLGTGTHSLTVTPTGNFWIRFKNSRTCASLIQSVAIEAAGILELPSPWATSDLTNLRSAQSADVTYVGCQGYQQRKIERRSLRSWSIVLYEPESGPFRIINITQITIAPSALTGDITLMASKPLFKSQHVGALFRITSVGQIVSAALGGADVYTDPIRVNGIGDQRQFSISISGTFVATLTVQYSVGAPGVWTDVTPTYNAAGAFTFNDKLDNQVLYYRIGIKPGEYTSGTANATLTFSSGSITGIARVTGFTDSTHVSAAVLAALGGTGATTDWSESAWSAYRSWPSTVRLHEGRLWWFGSKIYGSVSDDYENFDDTTVGDAGPISRSIGEGPLDAIHWALSLQRLMLGTATAEFSVRSSSLDEPLTPTNFNIKASSTQGSAYVDAVRLDKTGIYVDTTGQRIFQLEIDVYSYDYKSTELTILVPDLNKAGIVKLAVQRKPDTRVHVLRADGTIGQMVFDSAENVTCWQEGTTSGAVEDFCILPGTEEDQVYYTVNRTINGATVRYHEKWARESECTGLPVAKHGDAYVLYSGVATTTITGLSHLEGQTVVCWGWHVLRPFTDGAGNTIGRDLGTHTVTSGQITGLPVAVTNACVGLGYAAQWLSMKQAFAAAMGTPLNQAKRIDRLGLVLRNTHALGIQMGPDFDHLDDLPLADLPRQVADDTQPDIDAILVDYDQQMAGFNDIWSTDSRVALQAQAPRPAQCLAFTASMTTSG